MTQRVIGDWIIGETLGKGTYSWVKKGTHKKNKAIVALKFMRSDASRAREQARQVSTEIEALRQIDSPHVIKLYEYNVAAQYPERDGGSFDVILLVLEYAPGGELFDILYYTQALEETIARSYFHQLINGLEACHKAGVCHRDIKPQNLLLDHQYKLKITDFGLSKIFETDADAMMHTMQVGTRGYQAPELLIRQPYTTKADVFSVGVVLFILLAGYPPFNAASVKDKWYAPLSQGNTRQFWHVHRRANLSPEAQDFLSKVLEFDPQKRMGIDEIRQHPWFQGKTLGDKDLFRAIRLQHRQAEIKRKQDAKKQERLQLSLPRAGLPGVVDEKAPPLPEGRHATLTDFHLGPNVTPDHVLKTVQAFVETMRGSHKRDPNNPFQMESTIAIMTKNGAADGNLSFMTEVFHDPSVGKDLVCIKRVQGDFFKYKKVYQRLWAYLSDYADIVDEAATAQP